MLNKRKNIRLKDYDYKTEGCYFITLCTNYNKPYLENSQIKKVVVVELARLNNLRGVKLDYYTLMPNHIHLIVILQDCKYTLGEVMRKFKSKTTVFVKKYANQGWQLQKRLWQPNYYEHIIRNEKALAKIREYIRNNPLADNIKFEQFYESCSC
ncbi:MAG: transposase [Elusimicrobia bacterium]|nr:transposase [Elusimicrobiota bacterium]